SQFTEEFELLFTLGSIFRLKFVDQDEDKKWIMKMSLCGEDEHNLKEVLADMKKQNGTGETSLWTLGKLLWTMGKLDLAEKYYSRLLEEISPNDPSLRNLYADLSLIASQQGDYDKSVQWRQKSLEIKEQAAEPNSNKKGKVIKIICRFHEI
ncbi:unnamed protein product, partial [Rotaria sp. Silwood2]